MTIQKCFKKFLCGFRKRDNNKVAVLLAESGGTPEENAPSAPAPSPAPWPTLNHTTVTVFTLELRRQGLLVLLVLQRHRLRPLKLCVHLVRYHPAVQHPADHRDQQETLEDPPLPPGAHPVSHGGPAPLPAVCARKPRLCCWKLRIELFLFTPRWRPLTPHSPSIPTHQLEVRHKHLLMCA